MVLVMSVFPGFGGQKFIPSVLEKVREIRAIADGLGQELDIQIDGGINAETALLAREAGANILVAGNAVFKAENRAEMIAKLKA
jgi:ribulose-phosphate 3-epimerase